MDRFIVNVSTASPTTSSLFKIQYGQIYSDKSSESNYIYTSFKIQYGQIYRIKSPQTNVPEN